MAKKRQFWINALVKQVDHQVIFDSCKYQEIVLESGESMSDVNVA